jgi:hypothetical protein
VFMHEALDTLLQTVGKNMGCAAGAVLPHLYTPSKCPSDLKVQRGDTWVTRRRVGQ